MDIRESEFRLGQQATNVMMFLRAMEPIRHEAIKKEKQFPEDAGEV